VVAFGTALPEFSTSLVAMLVDGGRPEIAAGNALGSILANTGLALGAAAMFYGIYIDRKILETDLSFLLASMLAVFVVFLDFRITWIEGIFLIAIYLSFIRHEISEHKKSESKGSEKFRPRYLALFLAGIVLLSVGASYMIEAIRTISSTLGLSEAVVAVILLAVGTSLPEISTAIVAAKNGRGDIAMGDVLGANTFNALIILGVSSLVQDVAVNEAFVSTTLPVVVLISLLLGFMVLGNRITRFEGSMLVAIYFLEIITILTIL
jgi:cation:H+ antiporter